MWSYSVNHMLHGAVARIGGAIKRIEGADGAKYSATARQRAAEGREYDFYKSKFGNWEMNRRHI